MTDMIKVMVVDDTITYRQILSKVVETLDHAELAGTASSGKTALMKIPTIKPDVIFLDVMMPDMDGIETLYNIKKDFPNIAVVMVSAFDMENAKATLESLENGALDFIAKPVAQNMADGIAQFQTALTPIVSLLFHEKYPNANLTTRARQQIFVARESTEAPSAPSVRTEASSIKGKVDLVTIGISTGGPNALHSLFIGIPEVLPCPVLIVQHMPPMFTQSLAERLSSVSKMDITEAVDGEIAHPGHVYIAPGGKHLLAKRQGTGFSLSVTDTPPVNHCKPAVDVLFKSVSEIKNINVLSLILTGMGRDGTEGIKDLKAKGTFTIIQDEKTSVVWGMPGSVHESGNYDEML
ncbi:MAG: chemotaxis-specific protein-glutamate methyltransferase CheB, partial [SAR324 cluster bacterium]|nr:chemotaxis-specific protein-glutamate methyltransferase CheB [SAR324 cluster bacterium]